MRLWSIHPSYLDTKGLVGLWRESLLAKKVLEGKTKGYKFHPQLRRFKEVKSPVKIIDSYIFEVYLESKKRRFHFNFNKIDKKERKKSFLRVTKGQIEFEFKHLLKKLKNRDFNKLIC
ncbi:MAG: pyrimidine dimer DNA glycosylase/endonuclease V [Candidatus Pacearchaeota archaeon]